MQKIIIGCLLSLLLVASLCFAVTDNPDYDYEDKTNLGHMGLQGGATTGNPGYIEMKATDNNGVDILYYLWLKFDGDGTATLYIASNAALRASPLGTSFPTGDWRKYNDAHTGIEQIGDQ